MAKNDIKDKESEKTKKSLGKEIAKCRGGMSQRKLSQAIGIPPSNMKYIEDGVNAPTGDVYGKLMAVLKPPPPKRATMDRLYAAIRKAPPPDICEIVNSNQALFDAFRVIDGQPLSKDQISKVRTLFEAFADENKGEEKNGK